MSGAGGGAASDAPLGVFDSGLGGLTVVRSLLDRLPRESIVYFGDTARVPYGTRSRDTVVRYARGCSKVLLDRGVKAIVVACNTVSSVALELLRAEIDLPLLGVIDPGAAAAVRAAEELSRQGHTGPLRIGVLGTAGTIASGAYSRAVARLTTRYEVVGRAAPLLVPLVEEGWVNGEVPTLAVRRYLEPLIAEGAEVVVLGCTHYPLLKSVITQEAEALAGRRLPIVDSAVATADAVRESIHEERIAPGRPGTGARLRILVSDLPQSFAQVAGRFLAGDVPEVEQIDL